MSKKNGKNYRKKFIKQIGKLLGDMRAYREAHVDQKTPNVYYLSVAITMAEKLYSYFRTFVA